MEGDNVDYTILINKDNLLDKFYIPSDLVVTDNNENNFHKYEDPTLKPAVSSFVFSYFLEMQKEALKAGYKIIIDSGYRSYNYQQVIWDVNVKKYGLDATRKKVAIPGSSEHQSGLAFDIAYIIDEKYCDEVNENQDETKWLFDNCYRFGFILRYPKGKEDITGYQYEPWHYRFVGLELAKYIYENNLTLEEYYQKDMNKKR